MTRTRLDSLALLLAPALVSAPLFGLTSPAQDEADDTPRAFQVYDSPAVRDRVQSARDHLDDQRWSEALVDLQGLLEEHRGQVLPATRPKVRGGRITSQHPVFGGASEWATHVLTSLPPEARELYQDRHGAQAARALQAALAAGDRSALARVARRFPLTREATRAWWALGDLELERGEVSVGLAAWARGLEAALELELDPTSGRDWKAAADALGAQADPALVAALGPRIQIALTELEGGGELVALASEGRGGSAFESGGSLGHLGRDPDTWPRRFELPDGAENPFAKTIGRHSLFPARADDTVFVSTSRAVFAIGAYTGELVWRSAPNLLGWLDIGSIRIDGFAEAIAYDDSMIRPAVDRGMVVTALQVPFAFEDEDDYGELQIIHIIPERRLFAFDATTGELLWDTSPPEDWDGESGQFPERTTVVGSPVISGTRVLVPAARLRGRIELFVACYDLHTGELAWSTPVLTGQRPLNMFGRLVAEFAAPPVVVEGDRLLMQTQLGTVACLDLFTGEVIWHAIYDQILFSAGSYYSPGNLRSLWRTAPPVVVGSTVIAAPFDSDEMLAIDLDTGTVLWTMDHDEVVKLAMGTTRLGSVDALLGADERRVYLGGRRVVALEAPGGLASEPPRRRAWAYPAEPSEYITNGGLRPVVGDDRIYVPHMDRLAVLDRRSGKQVEGLTWSSNPGNLLLSEGTLFTLSGYGLNGYFEWDAMVRRARSELAKAPTDPRAIGNVSLLLYKRGLSRIAAGDYRRARNHLEDARRVVEGHQDRHPDLRATLHRILRAEGRNLRLAADPTEALRRLRKARDLAPSPDDERDTLLEVQAIQRDRDFTGWLETMGELERGFTRNVVAFDAYPEGGDSTAWKGPIMPVVTRLSEPSAAAEERLLPVGLWALVERAEGYSRRRKIGDEGHLLADLHTILAHYSTIALPGEVRAGEWAARRIGEQLAGGYPAAYAPFEAEAQALLERARSGADLALLERVPELYPHSRAAAASNDAQIEIALASGAVDRVAAIVLEGLPSDWTAAQASPRELDHLVRLASLFGDRGNLELRAGLVERLARHHPTHSAQLQGLPSVQLADLARLWTAPEPDGAPSATFTPQVSLVASVSTLSPFEPVGSVPPGPGGRGVVQLMCDGARLYAYGHGVNDEESNAPLWTFDARRGPNLTGEPLPAKPADAVTTSPGRVHVATLERVLTFDRDTGEQLWDWRSESRSLVAVAASAGVVVAREDLGLLSGMRVYRLAGLDAATGVRLWNIELLEERFAPRPVLGEGYLVLLPRNANPAQIFDLYTGSGLASFDLSFIPHRTRDAAWIEHGRIILPYFLRGQNEETNHVVAHDLATGELAWRVPLTGGPGGPRELSEVLSYDGRHFLNLWPVAERNAPRRPIGIFELHTQLGALATSPIAELPDDAESIGVKPYQHTWLNGPYLFALCLPRRDEEARFTVRAIHLRYGERWRVALPEEFQRTPASDLPEPAVSETTIALAFPLPSRVAHSRKRRGHLMMLDRASGRTLGTIELEDTSGREFTLSPFGGSLLVSRSREMELMR
ncbi:MAG: PQQ-binding-like beta-propeller repeat protein [Planctomycetota bacterium]|nr:PQQ-binding-like beta-propeller repeat protein [Planctomycetota bacterium]